MFLLAYFVVWTGFAVAALASDGLLHVLVERWRWLDTRPWLIAGSVLALAGAFQFSPLKERCLDACRSPLGFLWRYYRRGAWSAWRLGLRHGLFCLGCCWALMLVMFAVGLGNLVWMAVLTGVMVIEKTMPWGRRLVPVVGVVLLTWGGLVLVRPGWLPALLGAA
jgi:predicted metal-binding membrane protein